MKQEKSSPNFSQSTKMRIRTYSPSLGLKDDRLVEQATELRVGPKEPHSGPISLEFNLATQSDVDGMIEYIKKLKGELPIEPKAKKATATKIDKMLKDKEPLQDLLKTAQAKCKTQEELIEFLRPYNFKFIHSDVIRDMAKPDQIKLREKDFEYQFMVRLVKEAKVPQNDKWDWRLAFGIKIVGDRKPIVQIYLWGTRTEFWKLPWKDAKKMNFKKVEKVYIFPEMMDYADRKKWRQENRKKIKAEETKQEFEPSKFYKKWAPYINGL